MRRRAFLRAATGGALAVAILPRSTPAQTPAPKKRASSALLSAPAIDRIDARMRALLRETGTPGAALAIVRDGALAWQGAYGLADAETRKAVDAHTMFEAASVSKTVFAYAALKLCERGTLGLDTPLTRFSKQRFFTGDPQLDAVTARHVLSHTTGFPEWRSKEPLKCHTKPGERFLYSGEGYYYLQSVMTDVAGRRLAAPCGRYEADFEVCATDFDEFMRRSLLTPLGMNASTYAWHERFAAQLARPHDVNGLPLPRRKASAADVARYGAAGELRTTVGDLSKFLCAVLTQPQGDAFLGPAMHATMLRPQVKLDPDTKIDGADSWALGWAVQERPTGHVILHSGGQSGFRSLMMASLQRKAGFVLFTNGDKGGLVCYDQTLGELLTPLLAG